MNDEETIKRYIRRIDKIGKLPSDSLVDKILGIGSLESDLEEQSLSRVLGHEQFTYEGTPYNYICFFLSLLAPNKKDVVYDLGCGYGRVIFYGAITTKAKYKGIEIVPERVELAQKIQNNLKIENAQFVAQNALDAEISDGTIFFLFNPFIYSTLEKIGDKLEEVAGEKKIRIVTWGSFAMHDFFKNKAWLQEIFKNKPFVYNKLSFFESL